VSEENTQNINGGRTFEERVFGRFDALDARFNAVDARLDAIDVRLVGVDNRFDAVDARFNTVDSAIRNLDSRMQALEVGAKDTNLRLERLEARAYDTKPIWEQALKEIVETRREVSKRLDRIDAVMLENRADIRDAEDRIEKLEPKPI
jgi:chromosome segregation ATPase